MARILLTGATGFVGRVLSGKLAEKGEHEIHNIERYVTGRYTLSSKELITHYANLSDYSAVKYVLKEVKPDYCIHIGAITAVSFSYEHYMEVNEVNYLGTVNLAEACYRELPNFKQFIFAGTSEEYGRSLQDEHDLLNEDSILQPNSPYAVSKVAADMYLRYMHKAYGFPVTVMRPFNTYGRTDNTHFFIERTITQMLSRDEVILGAPDAIRDWVYIDDHVDAYIKALGKEKAIGEAIQICTGNGYSTKKTAEMIAKLTDFGGSIRWNSMPDRPIDAKILRGDNSKAKKILGWRPRYSLEEGLRKCIDYWRSVDIGTIERGAG